MIDSRSSTLPDSSSTNVPGDLESAYRRSVARREGGVLLAIAPLHLDGATAQAAEQTARRSFGATDATLRTKEGNTFIWLPSRTEAHAEAAAQELLAACGEERERPVIGLARLAAEDNLGLETLDRVALEGVRVARHRGAGSIVHTALYAMFETRIQVEREPAPQPAPISAESSKPVEPEAARSEPEQEAPRKPRSASPEPSSNDRLRQLLDALQDPALLRVGPDGATREPDPEEIDQFRRRIAKLLRALGDLEQRLEMAEGEQGGIASAFRCFQGLTGEEHDFDTRLDMMKGVLEENLALRDEIDDAA